MKSFDTIYSHDTLNIFTDASMYAGTYNGYSVGCAGVELATSYTRTDVTNHLYPNGYIPNYVVTLDTTNNNSELIAIRQGVLFALANKDRFSEINLFSDSLLAINCLTQWINDWFFKAKKSGDPSLIFRNSKGDPVANQDIIKSIIALIYFNDLKINFYHQRGHCSHDLALVKKDFIKFNRLKSVNVSYSFVKQIAHINDIVDNRSRQIMKTFIETGYAPYIVNNTLISGIEYDISRIYLKHYKNLIGR